MQQHFFIFFFHVFPVKDKSVLLCSSRAIYPHSARLCGCEGRRFQCLVRPYRTIRYLWLHYFVVVLHSQLCNMILFDPFWVVNQLYSVTDKAFLALLQFPKCRCWFSGLNKPQASGDLVKTMSPLQLENYVSDLKPLFSMQHCTHKHTNTHGFVQLSLLGPHEVYSSCQGQCLCWKRL